MVTSLIRPSYQNNFYSPQRGGIPLNGNLWKGLVGAWSPSLGVTGNKLIDQSGFRNDALNISSALWTITPQGYALDGSAGGVANIDNSPSLDFQKFTIIVRLKPSALAQGSSFVIISNRSGFNERFLLSTNSDNTWKFRMKDNSSLNSVGTYSLEEQTIAITFDGTNQNIYIDGKFDNTRIINGSYPAFQPTHQVTIGHLQNSGGDDGFNVFQGLIYSVSMQGLVLTLNEIMQLHIDPQALFRTRRLAIGRVPDVVGGADVRKHIIPAYMRMCA